MGHQRLQVDHPGCNQPDGLRVDVVVAVLEAQIDLLGRHVHERDILDILADANDEDRAAEPRCLVS